MPNLRFLFPAALTLALAGRAEAQAASSTDVILGLVTNDQGNPVADAIVEAVSVETQVTRSTKTNAKGRYTIVFPDGGGQYRITVRFIGMIPVQRNVMRQADEDRIVVNVKLSSTPVQLQELTVRARRLGPIGNQAPTPGSTERNLNPEQLARLPIDATDLTLLATLAPGVVSLLGNDSTAAGFSVAGQRPTANNVTLDGLSFVGTSVPQDGVRSTRVITSSYDPARGQFSGGLVASTTRSGTNRAQGTANYNFRDRDLSLTSTGEDAFATGFTQHQLSFGLGGPLIKNRLFAFGSALGRLRVNDLQTLLGATGGTLSRLGVASDSVTRLLSILDAGRVPVDYALADGTRDNDEISSLLRIDYAVAEGHTLTLRGDYRTTIQDPTRLGSLSVPSTASRPTSKGGGVMLSLNSRFGASVVNELRVYASGSSNRAPVGAALPAGRVQVISDLEGDTRGATTLSFGGPLGLPVQSAGESIEATNEISWIPGSGAHRPKLGVFLARSSNEDDATQNRFGTFTFASLADLEAGRPSSFTRSLSPTIRSTIATNAALYLADGWRVSDALQLTYGVRLEHSHFNGAPAYNPLAESWFGLRTDRWPSEWRLSPRMGFTWIIRSTEEVPPLLTVRGGIGEFRSPVPSGLVASAQAAPGLGATESQLVCIGLATPSPDWAQYRADPATIPTACAAPAPGPLPTRNPNITAFAADFGAPRAWRGSLGLQRRFGLTTLGAELTQAWGGGQFGVRDLNLGPPRFTLGSEGRPVYAPIETIDPTTGALGLFASRANPGFGSVLAFDSELESRSTQLTLTANGITRKGAFFNLSYTWSRARDQSSFAFGGAGRGFAAATTGGDPNVREWATSDFERRHSFLATMTYPVTRSLEVTTIARMTSGAPYTPLAAEDVNGDGARNDRAFVFAAATADTTVGNGMARLLAGTSGAARHCLERQTGQIAGRNSCRGPWQPSVDLQLNYRPAWLGLDQRLTVAVVTSNFLTGIDQLVNGKDGLKGWGQAIRPDPTLLVVKGFDPSTRAFEYAVNERFGARAANALAVRQPFQIGLQLRFTIGPDPMAQFRSAFAGRGRGGQPGAAGAPGATPFSRMASSMPNPAAEIIAIRIGLSLTDEQVKRLEVVSDSFGRAVKAVAEQAEKELAKAGANPDPGRLFTSIRPMMQTARDAHGWALKESEAILTPQQWAQVPERIKSIRRAGQGGRPPS